METLPIEFIKKRMLQQIKYMAEIERSDKPIHRKNEILESARGVYEYFNKLHYEYDKKMEITPEIKEKVFAQHWGQKVLLDGFNLATVDKSWNWSHPSFKLKLKPLSAISDEDAIEVNKLLKGFRYYFTDKDKQEAIKDKNLLIGFLQGGMFIDDVEFLQSIMIYQYLISKGYDMPNYHLGGKTLHEAGLAIYE